MVSELLERWDRDGAKEKFVSHCFDMRDTLQAGKFKEKFKPGQKEDIEALLQRTLDLLNSPQSRFGTEEDFFGDAEGAGRASDPDYDGGLPGGRRRWGARGRDA